MSTKKQANPHIVAFRAIADGGPVSLAYEEFGALLGVRLKAERRHAHQSDILTILPQVSNFASLTRDELMIASALCARGLELHEQESRNPLSGLMESLGIEISNEHTAEECAACKSDPCSLRKAPYAAKGQEPGKVATEGEPTA